MAIDPQDSPETVAARAGAQALSRSASVVADFFVAEGDRLDERTRLLLVQSLSRVVGALDRAIRRDAARRLAQLGNHAAAERLLGIRDDVARWLSRPDALPDELVEELIARVRHDLLAQALPIELGEADVPSLLVRLAGVPDSVVAAAAAALLAAESRRRDLADGDTGLTAELHHRLAWRVAAALRTLAGGGVAVDRALVEAARRSIAAHDEGEQVEAVAMRLALAIDARPAERGPLLIEALGDRRLALFIAVLAHALEIEYAEVRALVVNPTDERLWLCLRAAALDRTTVARIALALAEADPRRDIEVFADRLDTIAGIDPAAAGVALAPLALPGDYRAAIRRVMP